MAKDFRILTNMKIKTWVWLEKEDLALKIHQYSKFRLILFVSTAVGFFVSILWVWQESLFSEQLIAADKFIINLISNYQQPLFLQFFRTVTIFGSAPIIFAFFLILSTVLIFKKRKKAAAAALLSLTGSLFFVLMLKQVFGRPRPFGCDGYDCLSFPSGHSTLSFYFYGLLDYLILRFFHFKTKYFLSISLILGLIIVLIAFSRLVLNYHYLSDVIGGFFLGSAWLSLTVIFIDILY